MQYLGFSYYDNQKENWRDPQHDQIFYLFRVRSNMIIIAVVRSNAYVICYMSRTTSVSQLGYYTSMQYVSKKKIRENDYTEYEFSVKSISRNFYVILQISNLTILYEVSSSFFFRNRFFKSFFRVVNHEENMPLLFTNSHFYDRFFRRPEVQNIKE